MFGYLVATLLVVSGLVLVGYSFLIRDPFASAALLAQQPPSNSTMTLTVPEMRRVDRVPVYTGAVHDRGALHDGTLHLNSTGFPWQRGANVYIAGHRLGFPGTRRGPDEPPFSRPSLVSRIRSPFGAAILEL